MFRTEDMAEVSVEREPLPSEVDVVAESSHKRSMQQGSRIKYVVSDDAGRLSVVEAPERIMR